jgi:hypothetical protein
MTEEVKQQTEEAKQPKLPLVYVGPTSTRLGLVRWSQYTGLNENVQAAIKKFPALNHLLIPLEEFGTRARDVFAGNDASINHIIRSLLKQEVL